MKKILSLLLTIALLFTILPFNLITASAEEGYSAYLVKHYEDEAGSTTTDSNGTAFPLVDGPGESQKAVQVTNASAAPQYNLWVKNGYHLHKDGGDKLYYEYNMSVWVKADAAVTTDTVTFEIEFDNAEYVAPTSTLEYPEKVTEKINVTNAGLVQGEWVKVSVSNFRYGGTTSATYKKKSYSWQSSWTNATKSFKTNGYGKISVKVGDGIAYTMDDLTVIPADDSRVYNIYGDVTTKSFGTTKEIANTSKDTVTDTLDGKFTDWTYVPVDKFSAQTYLEAGEYTLNVSFSKKANLYRGLIDYIKLKPVGATTDAHTIILEMEQYRTATPLADASGGYAVTAGYSSTPVSVDVPLTVTYTGDYDIEYVASNDKVSTDPGCFSDVVVSLTTWSTMSEIANTSNDTIIDNLDGKFTDWTVVPVDKFGGKAYLEAGEHTLNVSFSKKGGLYRGLVDYIEFEPVDTASGAQTIMLEMEQYRTATPLADASGGYAVTASYSNNPVSFDIPLTVTHSGNYNIEYVASNDAASADAGNFSDIVFSLITKKQPAYEGGTASISSMYTSETVSYGIKGTSWAGSGNIIIGDVLSVTDTSDGDSAVIYRNSEIKYGGYYNIFIAAKALNDVAAGATFKAVLDYSETDDAENIPAAQRRKEISGIVTQNGSNVSATNMRKDAWTEYMFQLDGSSFGEGVINTSVGPNVRFELVGADGASLNGAQYLLGNVRVQQYYCKANALSPTGSIEANPVNDTTYNVNIWSHVLEGDVQNTVTRVMMPYDNDYVVVKTFDDAENNVSFKHATSDISGMKMIVNAGDRHGEFGTEYVKTVEVTRPHNLTLVAEFDQTVWAPEMKELSATIRYNAESGDEELKALCAMYDSQNKMVSSDVQEFQLEQGEGEVSLTMSAEDKTATKARVFLWTNNTHSPIVEEVPEITKKTDGAYIFVDAESKYGYTDSVTTFNDAITKLEEKIALLKNAGDEDIKDIYVILMPGYHKITQQVTIDADSSIDGKNVIITSYNKNDKGVLSGGEDISGKFVPHENGIYKANVGLTARSRQLFVNGQKAVKARSCDLTEADFTNTYKTNGGGLTTTAHTYLKDYARVQDIEFVFYSLWTMPRCQVSSISGDESLINITMDSPAWGNINGQGNTFARHPAYFENALELLDEKGEWYLNAGDGYVYYMPRDGEDINTAEVILPVYDNHRKGAMVNIEGTSSAPVKNVTFDNVEFAHTTYTRPDTTAGHYDMQNNHEVTADTATGDLRPGAVDVKYANNVDFTNCVFTKLGINGLRFLDGAKYCDVTGNEFYDISGSAINLGRPGGTSSGVSVRNPVDADRLEYDTITNNYIHNVATDYWSASAVSAGFPVNSCISHNEIAYVPYTGIHVGYGWHVNAENYDTRGLKDFHIEYNYIHDLLQGKVYDGGGIYTNGFTGATAENPNRIKGNYIANIGPGSAAIYNDNGSTGYHVSQNVTDISKSFREYYEEDNKWKETSTWANVNLDNFPSYPFQLVWEDNYSTASKKLVSNANSSVSFEDAILIDKNGAWPAEALQIIANAGIEEAYRDNFRYGLQNMKIAKNVTISAGDSLANTPYFATSKDAAYKNKDLIVYVSSSNESVATATKDRITGVAAGTAVITYTVVENGTKVTAKTKVTVR